MVEEELGALGGGAEAISSISIDIDATLSTLTEFDQTTYSDDVNNFLIRIDKV